MTSSAIAAICGAGVVLAAAVAAALMWDVKAGAPRRAARAQARLDLLWPMGVTPPFAVLLDLAGLVLDHGALDEPGAFVLRVPPLYADGEWWAGERGLGRNAAGEPLFAGVVVIGAAPRRAARRDLPAR